MCTVSNIGDGYRDNFAPRWPNVPVWPAHPSGVPVPVFPTGVPYPPQPSIMPGQTVVTIPVSKEEFEALKKEVEELKQLLKAAKKFDEETGQPDCHMDDKVEFIKKLAEYVGVDLEDIFKK
jgi:hypothetical protein